MNRRDGGAVITLRGVYKKYTGVCLIKDTRVNRWPMLVLTFPAMVANYNMPA